MPSLINKPDFYEKEPSQITLIFDNKSFFFFFRTETNVGGNMQWSAALTSMFFFLSFLALVFFYFYECNGQIGALISTIELAQLDCEI